MSSDRIQQQIEFIIEHQAKFTEDITRLEQQTKENTQNIARLTDVMLSLTNIVQRHDDHLGRIDDQIAELIAAGKETDARLNTLIILFERLVSKNADDKP